MPGADPTPPIPAAAAPVAAAPVAAQPVAAQHIVMFLPWVRLDTAATINGVTFVPWKDDQGRTTAALTNIDAALATILQAYVDLEGDSVTNCVVATIGARGASLDDADFDRVRTASALLFLAAWANNEYFHPFAGRYVNATNFRMVAQSFRGEPFWIALTSRHRDGRRLNGRFAHEDLAFTVPTQCFPLTTASLDLGLLTALDAALTANAQTMIRLLLALPFIELANADDDFMSSEAEAILMGSAFEQLLGGDASAYKLSRKFGVLFNSCGNVSVATALAARPGIVIDQTTPERAAAQPTWWTHRKWIEELYDLRSKSVHGQAVGHRSWGWTPFEHLLMAAVAFPLAVKLLLQRDGHYAVTTDDRALCGAMDEILSSADWRADADDDGAALWHRIIDRRRTDQRLEERLRAGGYI